MLKDGRQLAKAEHFFDWAYAQKVWFDMPTWEAEEAEWKKYAADFEPWLELYKADPRKAMQALKKYPQHKQRNIKRGYDIQLAYDHWWDHVYSPWYNAYAYEASQAPLHNRKAATFDDYLAVWANRPSCKPARLLNECGPVPDWRDARDRAAEQEMMAKAEAEAAKRKRK